MKQLFYAHADKYVLAEEYDDKANFAPPVAILTSYGAFYPNGDYIIFRGFLFSANRPAINTEDSRRAACVHDFFYSLMKDGHLSRSFREAVDKLFYDHLIEDGMISFRAWYWYKAVRVGGNNALDSAKPKVRRAPPAKKQQAGHQLRETLKN